MANIYVLLGPDLSPETGREFTNTIEDNGGRLYVLLPPRLALLDGDESTATALLGLIGGAVAAVGVEDVGPLEQAAGDDPSVTGLLVALAGTTTAALASAEQARPRQGEEWPGFGCLEREL
jgi:hypothetical protein